MLNFVFDNCAWENLFEFSNYESIRSRILQSQSMGMHRIWLSSTNMTEQSKGVTTTTYRKFRRYISEALDLAARRFILPTPTDYLFLNVAVEGFLGLETGSLKVRQLLAKIQSTSNYREYRRNFEKVVESVNTSQSELFDSVSSAQRKEFQREKEDRLSDATTKYSTDNRLRIYKLIVCMLITKYAPQWLEQPDGCVDLVKLNELISLRPSIMYFSEMIRVLLERTVRDGKKARRGDVFDYIQVLYLDICDYFVTDDRPLISAVEKTDLEDLQGRAIRLEEFLQHLDSPRLPQRSPILLDKERGSGIA